VKDTRTTYLNRAQGKRRTAEKAGFELEETRRKATNVHGKIEDEALYALVLGFLFNMTVAI